MSELSRFVTPGDEVDIGPPTVDMLLGLVGARDLPRGEQRRLVRQAYEEGVFFPFDVDLLVLAGLLDG